MFEMSWLWQSSIWFIGPYGGLPSQPPSPPIYLCFQRVTSIGQKKIYVHVMSKIIANLVYGLALHEFSVVQSG